jgi:hypothetical protein
MWFAGLAIAAIIVALVARRARRRRLDMGNMSDHWIAEQRLSQSADPNR